MNPDAGSLKVAMVTDVFFGEDGDERLRARLGEARAAGADLAVLPELPLDPWIPVSREARDEDAEAPGGPRQRRLARAARATGIGLLGGAVVRDPEDGRRYNTALLFDDAGALRASYRKLHLPDEDGFWETSHYAPGNAPPEPSRAFSMVVGVQICSDVNRPHGGQTLRAAGAEVLLVPRATPPETYDRWRLVLRANAVMASLYVVSVNRPAWEAGSPVGAASLAVAPDGSVMAETTDPVATVTLHRSVLDAARLDYPGYLPYRTDVFGA